jgi:prophage regulatory protein
MDNNTNFKKFIVLPQVQEIVPYSASHIWRLERSGEFPKRIRLGGNRVAWLQSEVESWIEGKIAARADGTPPVKLSDTNPQPLPKIKTLEQKE